MKATVGRIVHFHAEPGQDRDGKLVVPPPQAAIITHVHEDGPAEFVDLSIFSRRGTYDAHRVVGANDTGIPAVKGMLPCWTWPPRE
jgi:hypothetical protein